MWRVDFFVLYAGLTSSLRQNPLPTRQNPLLHSPSLGTSSLLYGYCKDCLSLVIKDYGTHTLSGIRKRRLKESSSQTTSSKNSLSHLLVWSLRSRSRKAQAIALTKPRHLSESVFAAKL
nr:MAG TPA: hypothetical protein [Caudoviricetes sp.]